jgi:hypothetical protein
MAIRPPLIVYGDNHDGAPDPGRDYGPEVQRRLQAIGTPHDQDRPEP